VTLPANPAAELCPLCATPVAPEAARCGACGYHLAGLGKRPGPFSVPLFWWTAMGFLAVYLVTLGVVALTH
jgi:hypothetical protein